MHAVQYAKHCNISSWMLQEPVAMIIVYVTGTVATQRTLPAILFNHKIVHWKVCSSSTAK